LVSGDTGLEVVALVDAEFEETGFLEDLRWLDLFIKNPLTAIAKSTIKIVAANHVLEKRWM